jgi:hypothetical protein
VNIVSLFQKRLLEIARAKMSYATRLQIFYSNPDLNALKRFWLSTEGFDRVEGSFSDGKGTCKFNVYLTSMERQQAQAAVVDLNQRFCISGVKKKRMGNGI